MRSRMATTYAVWMALVFACSAGGPGFDSWLERNDFRWCRWRRSSPYIFCDTAALLSYHMILQANLNKKRRHQMRQYWILYREPGFLVIIWFVPPPIPSPLSCQQVVPLSQSSCVYGVYESGFWNFAKVEIYTKMGLISRNSSVSLKRPKISLQGSRVRLHGSKINLHGPRLSLHEPRLSMKAL